MKLNRLYGASVNTGCTKLGDNEVLTLSISTVDDAYALAGEALLRESAEILCGLLLDPVLRDGVLEPENLALQKQYLTDSIQAEINEKRSYAMGRALSIMFENEPYGLRKLGYVEDMDGITPESATAAYGSILETARIEILHVGAGNPAVAREVFAAAFQRVRRRPGELARTVVAKAGGSPKNVVEEKKVSQSKLCLGFKTGVGPDHPQLSAFRLMNSVLGGSPSSKLFLNVREKLSLCYYASSTYVRSKGILTVSSGIETADYDRAEAEILRQLDEIRQGLWEDWELTAARESLLSALQALGDSQGALENYYLGQSATGRRETPEEMAALLRQVTPERIRAAAQSVQLDTIYFLKGKEA